MFESSQSCRDFAVRPEFCLPDVSSTIHFPGNLVLSSAELNATYRQWAHISFKPH